MLYDSAPCFWFVVLAKLKNIIKRFYFDRKPNDGFYQSINILLREFAECRFTFQAFIFVSEILNNFSRITLISKTYFSFCMYGDIIPRGSLYRVPVPACAYMTMRTVKDHKNLFIFQKCFVMI